MAEERKIPYKIYLEESEMPDAWYNVRADMKHKPAPLLNPVTLQPMTAQELGEVFCEELVKQELNNDDRYIEIPKKIRDFYRMYRPAPLVRAYCLEEKLQTPAKIYYKFEGNNTSGSHKLNSAIAQAFYAKDQGLKGVTTETGAGQWGTALSMACSYLDLDCIVFMVKCSYEQKPFRREVMRTYGASVTPSPSETTRIGRQILAEHPGTSGSLGCAISEAVEVATHTEGYRYVLGSVLNQVALHQSIIGTETKIAMDKYGIRPDIIIGCAGGRFQPGRPDRPLYGRETPRGGGLSFHRCGAGLLPQLHKGRVRLRLLRHRQGVPACKDVYPGERLYPVAQSFRRPPLPRHEPGPLPALPRRLHGGEGRGADLRVRRSRAVRTGGGHPARPGEQPRHQGGHRRGHEVQGDRRGEDDPLRPHRNRIL